MTDQCRDCADCISEEHRRIEGQRRVVAEYLAKLDVERKSLLELIELLEGGLEPRSCSGCRYLVTSAGVVEVKQNQHVSSVSDKTEQNRPGNPCSPVVGG